MAVVLATIRKDSWNTLYTYLQTTNPISTNNIFSAFNDTLVKNKGYPLVIITSPAVSFEKGNITGARRNCEVSMMFEIYHNFSEGVKDLADEVTDKLLDGSVSVFPSNGLKRMEITSGDYDAWTEGNKKIHRVSFTVNFMFSKLS
jgi:hypothetical protein